MITNQPINQSTKLPTPVFSKTSNYPSRTTGKTKIVRTQILSCEAQTVLPWQRSKQHAVINIVIDRRFRGAYCLLHQIPDNGSSKHHWNVGHYILDDTVNIREGGLVHPVTATLQDNLLKS
jgi:hypothetical protein